MSSFQTLSNFYDWYKDPFQANDRKIIEEPEFPRFQFYIDQRNIRIQHPDTDKLSQLEESFDSHLKSLQDRIYTPSRLPILIGNQKIDLRISQPIPTFKTASTPSNNYGFNKLLMLAQPEKQ